MRQLRLDTGVLQNLKSNNSGAAIVVENSENVDITEFNIQSCSTISPDASGMEYQENYIFTNPAQEQFSCIRSLIPT